MEKLKDDRAICAKTQFWRAIAAFSASGMPEWETWLKMEEMLIKLPIGFLSYRSAA